MTRLANLAAHRAARLPNVVPFPLSERIARDQARLAAARAVLREEGHDTYALRRAILDTHELGTSSDIEIADIVEAELDNEVQAAATLARDLRHVRALDRAITGAPPEPLVASQGLQRLTLAAIATTVILATLAIAHELPAKVARTVLQAEQERW